jgi:hypothetical protein
MGKNAKNLLSKGSGDAAEFGTSLPGGSKVGWGFSPLKKMSAPPIRKAADGRQVFSARTFPTPDAAKVDACRVGEHKAGCFTEDGTQIKKRKGEAMNEQTCSARGGATFIPKSLKAMRAGKTELEFISGKQATDYGLTPDGGPAAVLRMCWGSQQRGLVVPVDDPEKAQELALRFEDCVLKGGDAQSCAADLGQKTGRPTALAGNRKRKLARKSRR